MKKVVSLSPLHQPAPRWSSLAFAAVCLLAPAAWADEHTLGVPEYSSRPGAAYTIYLDVAGFNYTGAWYASSGSTYTPGSTLAVNDLASSDTFGAADQDQIKIMWARLAQSYSGFDVNVTTIDPAIAAGQSSTDFMRQTYYDSTPNIMHTVVGSQIRPAGTPNTTPGNKWFSDGADGVSPGIGVAAGISVDPGSHTNWMFSEAQAGAATGGTINGNYIGAISAHENGHSLGLYHQGDFVGAATTPVNEYTNGDNNTGNGSYVAIIGNADARQRITWRTGDTHPNDIQTVQNDVGLILSTNTVANGRAGAVDLHLVNDGIGRTMATATALPLNADGTIKFSLATGIIVPKSETDPQALGASNYTAGYFKFTLGGSSLISITAHDGTQYITAGVTDGNGTLRSTLSILDENGSLLSSATEDGSTLFETYSGTLAAGTYFAAIGSFGGHTQDTTEYNASSYFDMGSYFLTGSGFSPVPEPSTIGIVGIGLLGCFFLRRRRRA